MQPFMSLLLQYGKQKVGLCKQVHALIYTMRVHLTVQLVCGFYFLISFTTD